MNEKLSFFIGEYNESSRISAGGGIQDEGEHIEVLELLFPEALSMVERGEIIDGKTIMILHFAALHDVMRVS